jgi:hypothetical protein
MLSILNGVNASLNESVRSFTPDRFSFRGLTVPRWRGRGGEMILNVLIDMMASRALSSSERIHGTWGVEPPQVARGGFVLESPPVSTRISVGSDVSRPGVVGKLPLGSLWVAKVPLVDTSGSVDPGGTREVTEECAIESVVDGGYTTLFQVMIRVPYAYTPSICPATFICDRGVDVSVPI